jgi:hypothetical protein
MKGLGMQAPAAVQQPDEVLALKRYEVIIWLFSLGVIFLVVASIGAMSLHSAMRGFTGMTGGALYDTHRDARHGNMIRDELKHAQLDLKLFTDAPSDFRRSKLAEFISVYTEGVVAGGYNNARRSFLLNKANETADLVRSEEEDEDSSDNIEHLDNHRNRKAAQA